jgi:hypothetical protein
LLGIGTCYLQGDHLRYHEHAQRKHVCSPCWTNSSLVTTLQGILAADVAEGFATVSPLIDWRLKLNRTPLGSSSSSSSASLANCCGANSSIPLLQMSERALRGGQPLQPSTAMEEADDTLEEEEEEEQRQQQQQQERLQLRLRQQQIRQQQLHRELVLAAEHS